MKFDNQLRYAVQIVEAFRGEMPLHTWLKSFFRLNKQMGSKDRKQVSGMVYGFYRLGHGLQGGTTGERIITGIFLCNDAHSELLRYFKPEWDEKIMLPLSAKLAMLNIPILIAEIFPWKSTLSEGIDHVAFCASFLIQPDLFLRLRPGHENKVRQKLKDAGIAFRTVGNSGIGLTNATKIDELIVFNREAVVQDYSSQRVGELLKLPAINDRPLKAWDCCAASGGKSIMLYDLHPAVELTVSDIRESILINLKKRFSEAGIKKYTSFIADLSFAPTLAKKKIPTECYDLVIADLPCTGSGTWSRTPESLSFFKPEEIQRYHDLQKKILSNVIPSIKKGGRLVYITCSVFKKENEEIVDFIRQQFHLEPERIELLKGYEDKADSMFVACFIA